MLSAGIDLRKIRERLGLTMRDVENASTGIANRRGSDEYLVPPSRLSDIETKGVIPSVFRFYSLGAIYRKPVRYLLQFYGIDLDGINGEWTAAQPARTHIVSAENDRSAINVPIKLDPGFDVKETSDLGRMVQQWGIVPFTLLHGLVEQDYTYAYIGAQDFTMYPILPPGSFVQVDESKRRIVDRQWKSEYERPIYFVEMRDGFTCCWCSLRPTGLVLQSHPLSPVPVRILKHPQEAEVIGQVIGVAMRVGSQTGSEPPALKESAGSKSNAILTPSGTPRVTSGTGLTSLLTRKRLG
ncbi:MAG: helix-turn-helix transcriptional regulator [Terriglobales bacterium]